MLLILPAWLVAAQVAHTSPSSSPVGAGPASVLASLDQGLQGNHEI